MVATLGPFLYVLFWVVVVSVVVFALAWYGAMWFPGRRRRARKGIGHPRGKKPSSQASLTEETEVERHRKAS